MKALIISDDQSVISKLDSFFQHMDFDTIFYRWLLKALDNIEEIRPDLIIVSANEYPRHWKTLVQFVKSGIGGDKIGIFLYEPNPLSAEDEEKAKLLGIGGYFNSLDDQTLVNLETEINTFFDFCYEDYSPVQTEEMPVVTETDFEQPDNESIPTVDSIISEPEKEQDSNFVKGTGLFILTNPKTNKLVHGNYFDYNGAKITLDISDAKNTEGLDKNTHIDVLTFFDEELCKSCNGKVSENLLINDSNLLIFSIGNFYEEK